MAMTWTVVGLPEDGENSGREYQLPRSRTRRRESLNFGNFNGKSLAVRREQKSGPHFHVEVRPQV